MLNSREVLIVLGVIVFYITSTADCRNGGPNLKNTLSEANQNVGEKCFAQKFFDCKKSYQYRMIDAGCTNLDAPSRGMAGSVFIRLLPALYKDNTRIIRTQRDGTELNSARVISNIFFTEQKEKNLDKEFTLSMMQWGQVVSHDITGTSGKTGPVCCTADSKRLKTMSDNCVGIKIPTNDRFYEKFGKTCLHMPRTKNTDDLNCAVTPVLPLNFVTCYLDASLLYGSLIETNKLIRSFKNGEMKSQNKNGNMFPPNIEGSRSVCRVYTNEDLCVQAGDNRANAHPMLTVLQTILLRLHNIIVKEFRKLNPKWDDEKLFQETRRLVIAMEQHITFKYYLPNLLGKKYLESIGLTVKDNGYNNIYDKTVNPQMVVEFSGCAFRSLHSTIVDKVVMYNDDRKAVSMWKFSDFYNAVEFITEGENFEQLVIGMATDAQGNLDRFFPTSITDLLFQVNGVGGDMESLDIEKGRDLGLNTFPKYLEMIGKKYPTSWDDYTSIPKNMIERLKTRYHNYEDVEPFIGGVLEEDAEGALIGPVFQAIIADQFNRLQKGDRFYYELGDQIYPFKPEQLQQIRKVTLSLLYCYTCPKLKRMQPDAFRLISENNQLKSCKDIIGDFSLQPWAENKK